MCVCVNVCMSLSEEETKREKKRNTKGMGEQEEAKTAALFSSCALSLVCLPTSSILFSLFPHRHTHTYTHTNTQRETHTCLSFFLEGRGKKGETHKHRPKVGEKQRERVAT